MNRNEGFPESVAFLGGRNVHFSLSRGLHRLQILIVFVLGGYAVIVNKNFWEGLPVDICRASISSLSLYKWLLG